MDEYIHSLGNKKVFFLKALQSLISNLSLILLLKFLKLKVNKRHFEIIISSQIFAPWKRDKIFANSYKKFKKFTVLDIKRAYTLFYHTKNLQYVQGNILDLGCMMGGVGFMISHTNKSGCTYLIDTFEGYKDKIKVKAVNTEYKNQSWFSYSNIKKVRRNIKKFKLKNTKVCKGFFPNDFEKKFKKLKIKLCHIDVNTYLSVKNSFYFVKEKMVKNGVIIFDDYGIPGNLDVIKFIDTIQKNTKIKKNFHILFNYVSQCIMIRK
jgi:hypothetical protein